MKYAQQEIVLSQEQRKNLNDKVIYLIDSDSADASGITKEVFIMPTLAMVACMA